jgi:hypothetical protein
VVDGKYRADLDITLADRAALVSAFVILRRRKN